MPRVERRSSEQPTRRRETVTQTDPRTAPPLGAADQYGGPLRRRNDQQAESFDPDESLPGRASLSSSPTISRSRDYAS